MVLNAGEQISGGEVRDPNGRMVVTVGSVPGSVLAAVPQLEQTITVTNQMIDPRATTVGNFVGVAGGSGSISQNPTNRVDGYQQQATPLSCVEIVGTPSASSYVGVTTALHAGGHAPNAYGTSVVAARAAFKVSGAAGTSWYAALVVGHYNSGSLLAEKVVATTINAPAQGAWTVLRGYDNQGPAATTYTEISVRIYNSTAGTPVTLRATELVIVVDPEGDIPGYVGGDATYGAWAGTADASQSTVSFDPGQVYLPQLYGFNDFASSNNQTQLPYTAGQAVGLYRQVGANVARVSFPLQGSSPNPPAPSASSLAYLQALIAAGVKLILDVGAAPAWMSPTALPSQSGNGGSITSGATSMIVSGAAPANLATPFTFQWSDGSTEVATCTSISTNTWTITRGSGATSHNDGVGLSDANYAAFGHLYYPDSGFRALYATAVTNLIALLGPENIAGVQVWNEPNLFVQDTRNEGAAGYTALLNAVYAAVRAQVPSMKVLGGTLAAVQAATNATGTDAVTFLGGMYTASALYDYCDFHVYPGSSLEFTGSTADPGSASAGIDRCVTRIKNTMAANSDTRQIFVSEIGVSAAKPDERVQARSLALAVGRLRQDPACAGVLHNGLTGLGTGGDTSLWDQTTLRPRVAAKQMARMNGRPRLYIHQDGGDGWTACTLGANWSSFGSGYAALAYRRDENSKQVQLRGAIKSSGSADTSVIATLPSGCRPAFTKTFVCYCYSSVTAFTGLISIGVNGAITWSLGGATNTIVDFDTIPVSFPAGS